MGAILCLGVLLADGLQRSVPMVDIALALSVPLGYAVANTVIRRSVARFQRVSALRSTRVQRL